MFDIGFVELLIVAVVALIVVGPEKLPKLARTVGLWIGKAKQVLNEVKYDIDKEVRNQEILEVEKMAKQVDEIQQDLDNTIGVEMAKEEPISSKSKSSVKPTASK